MSPIFLTISLCCSNHLVHEKFIPNKIISSTPVLESEEYLDCRPVPSYATVLV